jgi:hypothetical protein
MVIFSLTYEIFVCRNNLCSSELQNIMPNTLTLTTTVSGTAPNHTLAQPSTINVFINCCLLLPSIGRGVEDDVLVDNS